jgi:hypothetical protein
MDHRNHPSILCVGAVCLLAGSITFDREPRDHTPEPGPCKLPPAPVFSIGSNHGGTAVAGPAPWSSALMRWPDDLG